MEVRGHAPPRKQKNSVYLDEILSLIINSKYDNFFCVKNNHYSYTVYACYGVVFSLASRQIFGNILQLMRFGVYLRKKLNKN